MIRRAAWAALVAVAVGCRPGPPAAAPRALAPAVAAPPDGGVAPGQAVARLRREAAALGPLVGTPWVRRFLDATAALPAIEPRTVFHDRDKEHYYSEAQRAALSDAERAALVAQPVDEEFYYDTKYGTALAYARPLDLLGEAGLDGVDGKRVLDFGHGTIGHLRLLASLGGDMVGVDVDPLLPALYAGPGDLGKIPACAPRAGAGTDLGGTGSVRLQCGHFPGNPAVVRAVGTGYDVFVSKNTLKNGYVHPAPPPGQVIEPRRRFDLGATDEEFVRAIDRVLKPGGRAIIYNICPGPNRPGRPYRPWADGRNPFPRPVWEASGFRVLAFDRDDSAFVRTMARTLGWDKDGSFEALETDLYASYSLFEKPLVGGAPR